MMTSQGKWELRKTDTRKPLPCSRRRQKIVLNKLTTKIHRSSKLRGGNIKELFNSSKLSLSAGRLKMMRIAATFNSCARRPLSEFKRLGSNQGSSFWYNVWKHKKESKIWCGNMNKMKRLKMIKIYTTNKNKYSRATCQMAKWQVVEAPIWRRSHWIKGSRRLCRSNLDL